MSTPENSRLLAAITARSATDLEFRKQLLSSPAEAIRGAFGVQIPKGMRLRFIEKPAGVDTLIVLPDVQLPDNELGDDDLDAVAGGNDPSTEDCEW